MQINAKHSLSSALSTFTWRFSRFGFDLIFRCVTRGFSSHATHCVYLMDFSSASAAEEVQFVRVCLFVFPLYDCVWVLFCWLRSLQFPGLCWVEPKSTPPAPPPPPPLHPMQQLLMSCVCHTNNGNTFAAISHLSVYLCVHCVCVCACCHVHVTHCLTPPQAQSLNPIPKRNLKHALQPDAMHFMFSCCWWRCRRLEAVLQPPITSLAPASAPLRLLELLLPLAPAVLLLLLLQRLLQWLSTSSSSTSLPLLPLILVMVLPGVACTPPCCYCQVQMFL